MQQKHKTQHYICTKLKSLNLFGCGKVVKSSYIFGWGTFGPHNKHKKKNATKL